MQNLPITEGMTGEQAAGLIKKNNENTQLATDRYFQWANGLPGNLQITIQQNMPAVNSVTITINGSLGIGLLPTEGPPAGFKWLDPLPATVLTNGQGLAYNTETKTTEVVTELAVTSFNAAARVLLFFNFYGVLRSPHAMLDYTCTAIQFGTSAIKLTSGDIPMALSRKRDMVFTFDSQQTGVNPYYTAAVVGTGSVIPSYMLKEQRATFGDSYGLVEYPNFSAGASGVQYSAPVPIGKKVRFYIQYKSAVTLKIGLYFRDANDANWINNPGAVIKDLPANSTGDVTGLFTIDRNYEAGTAFARLFIGSATNPLGNIPSTSNLEIGIVKCEIIGITQTTVAPTIVTVNPTGNYVIRQAIEAITDASPSKPYTVFVKNGTYFEIDIRTKSYVNVIGETRDGVIIYTDGTSSTVSPLNYSWNSSYSGIPINTIPKAWRHQWVHMSNSIVENMTFKVNQTKYVVHQDNSSQTYSATFKNCLFVREEDYLYNPDAFSRGLLNLVGVGAQPGQYQIYEDCDFILRVVNLPDIALQVAALFWHNWNNKTIPCGATLRNCNVFGCNIANLSDLGSNTDDVINLLDVRVDDAKYGVYYGYTPGYYIPAGDTSPTSDPALIPYNIRLNIRGGNLNYVVLLPGRENGFERIKNPETVDVLLAPAGTAVGTPLELKKQGFGVATIATSSDFVLAYQAAASQGFIYANKGTIGYGRAEPGTYAIGDALYINAGLFTKTVTGAVVAQVADAVTLATTGLVMLRKLSA